MKHYAVRSALAFLAGIAIAAMPAAVRAQVTANPPYSVSTFVSAASLPKGVSAPDSITFSPTDVFIGYSNGGAPDGSGGAVSNVIEYDFTGKQLQNIRIVGHNDGLRYNPLKNQLWALQNEDGNANLDVIDLRNGTQTIYQLGTGPHGGGYDDIVFNNKSAYLSASAPNINPNTAPAILSITLKGKKATLTGILNGNATATEVTTGKSVTLNLQDPDSMILNARGELVMTSQGDGELIIVQNPGLKCQNALVVPLTSEAGGSTIGDTQLDDTVFTIRSSGELLVADKGLNAVYSITAPYFGPAAYSAVSVFASPSDSTPIESFVGQTDLTTGFVSPIVTGMSNPGGMAFIPSDADLKNFVKDSVEVPEGCPQS